MKRKQKGHQLPGIEPKTPGLCSQCCGTELPNQTPPALTMLYMYCTGGTKHHSCIPSSHNEWLLGMQLWHFSTTCAAYKKKRIVKAVSCPVVIVAVAEQWLHKPGILGSISGGGRPFHFLLFHSSIFSLAEICQFVFTSRLFTFICCFTLLLCTQVDKLLQKLLYYLPDMACWQTFELVLENNPC